MGSSPTGPTRKETDNVTPGEFFERGFGLLELIFWIVLLVPSITGVVLVGILAALIVKWSSSV